MKKKNLRYLLAAAALTVIVVIIALMAHSEKRESFVISATTTRHFGNLRWNRTLNPPKVIPKPNPDLLASFKPVIDQPGKIRYEYTTDESLYWQDLYFPVSDLHDLSDDHAATGTVQIMGYATAMIEDPPEPENNTSDHDHRPLARYRYFHPDGTPMDDDTASKMDPDAWGRPKKMRDFYHYFKVFYRINGLDSPQIVNHHLFDRQTRTLLASTSSTIRHGNICTVCFALSTWRPVPCDLVIDLTYGPDQTREINLTEGAVADFDDIQFTILKILRGQFISSSCGFDITNSHIQKHFLEIENQTLGIDNQVRSIIFGMSPACLNSSLSIEMHYEIWGLYEKQTLNTETPNIGRLEINTANQIHKLKIIYRPNRLRFILPVDDTPGLPDSNHNLKNLADVKIPYIKFDNARTMRQTLRSLLLVETIDDHMTTNKLTRPLKFPRIYTNVTTGELLDDWLSQYPGCQVHIDVDTGKIEIRPSKTIGRKISDFLNKI